MALIITEFLLEHYGDGNPLRVLDLGNGLNVALVRSEPGRAQLLGVVPHVLYGRGSFFPGPRRRDGPRAASSHAAIFVRSDHGVFRLERDWDAGKWGAPRILSPDGTQYKPSFLRTILDGIGRNAYRDVFILHLQKLQRIVRGGQHGTDRILRLAEFLRDHSPQSKFTGARPAELDFQDVETQLESLAAVVARQAAKSEKGTPETPPPTANRQQHAQDLKRTDTSLAETRAKLEHLETEIDHTQGALAMNRAQSRLTEVSREIAGVEPPRAPRESVASTQGALDRLDEKIAACREQLQQLADERGELDSQRKTLGKSAHTARLVPQIEAVLMQEKALLKEEEAIEQLTLRIEEIESRLEAQRLHAASRPADMPATQLNDAQSYSRIDQLAARLRQLEHELKTTTDRLEIAESAQLTPLSTATTWAANPADAVALHEAEQRVHKLRELATADDKFQRLEADAADVEMQVQRLYGRQLMPFRTALALGVPFMIGVAMVIYGLVMRKGQTNWQLVLLGITTAFVTALIKTTLDRSVSDRLLAARNRLSRIKFDQQQLQSLRDDPDASGVTLAGQLDAAERELEELKANLAGDPQRAATAGQTAGGSPGVLQAQLQDLQRQQRETNGQWRDLMLQLDLPPISTPAQARQAVAARAVSQGGAGHSGDTQLEFQHEQLQHELQRRRDWLAVAGGQLRQLLKELGHTSVAESNAEQIDLLRETLAEHRQRTRELRQVARAGKRIRQKVAEAKQTGRRLSEHRRQLQGEMQLRQEQQKLKTRLQQDRVNLLERQRARLAEEIDELRTTFHLPENSSLLELPDQELQSRLASQSKKLASLRDKLVKLSERRGRCLAQIATGREPAAPSPVDTSQWDEVLAETRKITRQLRRTTKQAAAHTQQQSQQHQQLQRFEYLEHAGRFLATLTGDQYVGFEMPEQSQLMLRDAQGGTIELPDVTREHFANIYFSLWLAQLETYADKGVLLPVVMDDPLPATRKSRRKAVARLLTELATRGHQLILVTASSQSARTFAQLDVPVADLSDRESIPVQEVDDEVEREAALS